MLVPHPSPVEAETQLAGLMQAVQGRLLLQLLHVVLVVVVVVVVLLLLLLLLLKGLLRTSPLHTAAAPAGIFPAVV
jgi:hypothetical protein